MNSEFSWHREIDKAISKKPTFEENDMLVERTFSWDENLCGRGRESLAVQGLDDELNHLDSGFMLAIINESYVQAKWYLAKIDMRVAHLLSIGCSYTMN